MPEDITIRADQRPLGAAALAPSHVLVLENSRAQRRLLATLLRKWGHEVTVCATPAEALDILRRSPIPIVLTDWMMPGMSGPDFCRAFRLLDRESYGYVILLTSKSDKSEIAQGLEAGADDFVTKPVTPPELRARIQAGERIVAMQTELVRQNRQIRTTLAEIRSLYDALDRDLLEAKRLQDSLVPEIFRPVTNGSVALALHSSGHVGGDLVGMFPIPGDRLGLFSLDVSGHGVTSALVTARMAGLLGTAAPEQNVALIQQVGGDWAALPPDAVAAKLNAMMFNEVETDLYFTLCLADVDLTTGRVRMVQAGHPHPAILHPGGDVTWAGDGGMPIGLLPNARFETIDLTLSPGDRLILHSDGFTECAAPMGGFLGDTGLASILARHAETPHDRFLPQLVAELERFGGRADFDDDVSALSFQFTP
ncbi:PP2C family protein-serine/threonine phosphatase [Nioella nitratireducens]|uniref:PP2C family protein-serine/threonine phosphatase n=1 Tax=Nioella nitratireducens TaxID=1287720 RepID=UPI000B1F709C|nr:SpoIIE family protein phosphatase [Nioella nitratireducens]